MRDLRVEPYLLRLYLITFVLFMLNKLVVRPLVLGVDAPVFLDIIVLSAPNVFEAVFGMGNACALLMIAKLHWSPRFDHIPDRALYVFATVAVGVFVLTQEFKLHDLGGRNVYDPYDAAASVLGIAIMLVLVLRYGTVMRVARAG